MESSLHLFVLCVVTLERKTSPFLGILPESQFFFTKFEKDGESSSQRLLRSKLEM